MTTSEPSPSPSHLSLWGLAGSAAVFILAGGLLLASLLVDWELPQAGSKPETRTVQNEYLFFREGANLSGDVTTLLSLLYRDESVERRIAALVLESLVHDALRQGDDFRVPLEQLNGPYRFTVQEGQGGLQWSFAAEVQEEELAKTSLEEIEVQFASSFSAGIVRERQLPSDIVYRDVVEDKDGVVRTSETFGGTTLFHATHIDSGQSLHHAVDGDTLVIASSRDLLLADIANPPSGIPALYADSQLLARIQDIFPSSDVTLFIGHMAQEDGHLSLSSYQCLESR